MLNKDKGKKIPYIHGGEIIALYKSLVQTIVFVMISFFTLVFVSTAWFAANSNVNSGTAPISAEFEPIKLAVSSKDFRTISEKNILKLLDGQELPILKDQEGNSLYYTDNGTIALRLEKDGYEVSPGAKGKVEFYVVPGRGTTEVKLDIVLGAYGETSNNVVDKIDNPVLTALITGHILFFDDYENGVYSNWLLKNDGNNNWTNSITVDLSGKEAGIPVKVDLYWIWPTRYKNMVNDFGGTGVYGFAESQANKEKMTSLTNKYRYSYVYLSDKQDLSSDSVRSEGYDLADEYIGSNAQYLYLEINTSNGKGQS